ncbi:MAG TPA: alpha/beta hydrolase [Mycobacterium sp.]|nr:alpha/beta hydrolase [Mycobacterium sp.]
MTDLAYEDRGSGEPVLFIAGWSGTGNSWQLFQAPAFLAAGYRVLTFDNRGVGATGNSDDFTAETMVADTAELIESLDAGPVRIVAASMGSFIAQELMLARPGLVHAAVLMATRGRHDRMRDFWHTAEIELATSGIDLPPRYSVKTRLLDNFSPKTLNDDAVVAKWIAMLSASPIAMTPGLRRQFEVAPRNNRLSAYRNIEHPVLVVGFADDVATPPFMGREVADALPDGRYLEIPDAGHLGFMERSEVVNDAALQFFAETWV